MMKTTEGTNQPFTFAFTPAFAHTNAIYAGRKWVNGVRHTRTFSYSHSRWRQSRTQIPQGFWSACIRPASRKARRLRVRDLD